MPIAQFIEMKPNQLIIFSFHVHLLESFDSKAFFSIRSNVICPQDIITLVGNANGKGSTRSMSD